MNVNLHGAVVGILVVALVVEEPPQPALIFANPLYLALVRWFKAKYWIGTPTFLADHLLVEVNPKTPLDLICPLSCFFFSKLIPEICSQTRTHLCAQKVTPYPLRCDLLVSVFLFSYLCFGLPPPTPCLPYLFQFNVFRLFCFVVSFCGKNLIFLLFRTLFVWICSRFRFMQTFAL